LGWGNYFKATKKRAKHLHSQTVEEITSSLRRNLDTLLASPEGRPQAPKAMRDHVVSAVCRIVASCRKTLTFDISRNGFILQS
jgi:hypothetical protein